MKSALFFCLTVSLCFLMFNRCDKTPVHPEREETGPAAISGKLLNADGVTPASGAIVTLRPRNAIISIEGAAKKAAFPEKKQVQTASDGSFSIDSCLSGVYVLEGADGEGNAARIDSVVVINPDVTTRLPGHPLKSTGALHGTVALDNGGDPSNVFILVFGSDRFMQVNNEGSFLMENLPYGNYTLKIVSVQKGYGNSLTIPVTVHPGDTVDVGALSLIFTEVPVPKNVAKQYDSVKMSVTLRWDPGDSAVIHGYNIYKFENSNLANQYPLDPLTESPVNSFIDYDIVADNQYTYGVATVLNNGSISRKAGPFSVITVSAAINYDSILYPLIKLSPIGAHWDRNGKLMVVTSSRKLNNISIDYYNDNFELLNTSFIVGLEKPVIHLLIRDDYIIYKEMSKDDSIHCYWTNGIKRYSVNLNVPSDFRLSERNDTLYVKGAAYDTAGNYLFTYDETGNVEIVQKSNENMYTLTDDQTVKVFNPATNSFSIAFHPCILPRFDGDKTSLLNRRPYDFDINAGLCYFYWFNELLIHNADGFLQSRLVSENINIERITPIVFTDDLIVDSSGRIAFISSSISTPDGKSQSGVIILSPRQ